MNYEPQATRERFMQPLGVVGFLLDPVLCGLAVPVVVASFLLDPQGAGVPLCLSKWLTHLPCPGCGLSRSCIAFARGDLLAALGYNPAGLLIYPMLFAMALFTFFPQRWKQRVTCVLERAEWRFYPVLFAFVCALLLFGLSRTLYYALSGVPYR